MYYLKQNTEKLNRTQLYPIIPDYTQLYFTRNTARVCFLDRKQPMIQ